MIEIEKSTLLRLATQSLRYHFLRMALKIDEALAEIAKNQKETSDPTDSLESSFL